MRESQAILVVDDEPNFLRILEAKLRKSGYDVVTAADAASGIERLNQRAFDLVLLDVRLPDANALQILPRLRAAVPNTPFLLMTAYEEEGLRDRAVAAGAVNVLYKPFDLDYLVQAVRLHVAEGRRQTQLRKQLAAEIRPTAAVHQGQAVVVALSSEQGAAEYPAQVTDTSTDSFVVVSDRALPAAVGSAVDVRFTGEDGLYTFSSRVVSAGEQAGTRVALAKPDVLRRHQRRKHPRVEMHVPVTAHLANPTPGAEPFVHGMSQDISMGGVSFLASAAVDVGTPVEMTWSLPLPDPAPGAARAPAVIARCHPVESGGDITLYLVGARFTRLTGESRARVRLYLATRPAD